MNQKTRDTIQKIAAARPAKDDGSGMMADFIEGARNNTFGRPVVIQKQASMTPLQLAYAAGQYRALKEAGRAQPDDTLESVMAAFR